MNYFELYEKRKQLKPGSVWTHWRFQDSTVTIISTFNCPGLDGPKIYLEYTLDDKFCSHYRELYAVLDKMEKIRD